MSWQGSSRTSWPRREGRTARELGRCGPVSRRALLLHIQAEELLLIPEYGLEQPDDAEALMEDHAFFRAALDDFEVNLEVRLRNEHEVRAFTNRLDTHARAEDEGLYVWARGGGVATGH